MDKWEVAGLLFLSTETKDKVETGLQYFKSSLPYSIVDGFTKFIFFADKDFDYIDVRIFLFSSMFLLCESWIKICNYC